MTHHCDLSSKAIPLAPLAQFDHPPLHRRPTNIVEAQADCQMDILVRKECAGLRHDLRTTGAQLRNAFRSGRFEHRERASLRWVVSGMREDRFSTWHSLCALTIYELARGMRCIDITGGGYGEYLHQWAENPDLPLPSAAGWTLYINDLSHLPRIAVDMIGTDPRRQDISRNWCYDS